MVDVIRVPIKSDRDEAASRPWFNLDWDIDHIQVGDGNSCFGLPREGQRSQVINKGLCERYQGEILDRRGQRFDLQEWVFCMLMDGTYAFMPSSQLPNIIMAHLGIYTPANDVLRLLEFVDRVLDEEPVDRI